MSETVELFGVLEADGCQVHSLTRTMMGNKLTHMVSVVYGLKCKCLYCRSRMNSVACWRGHMNPMESIITNVTCNEEREIHIFLSWVMWNHWLSVPLFVRCLSYFLFLNPLGMTSNVTIVFIMGLPWTWVTLHWIFSILRPVIAWNEKYKPFSYVGVHNDVIKWKHFPRYLPFVRGIHRSPVKSPHKGQWRGALMFSLICAWINDIVNNGEACDLRRHRDHYDVIVMGGDSDDMVRLKRNTNGD